MGNMLYSCIGYGDMRRATISGHITDVEDKIAELLREHPSADVKRIYHGAQTMYATVAWVAPISASEWQVEGS